MRRGDVLLVDDNEQNRILTRDQLESAGHTVTLASGGHAAIGAFEERPFDLILLDIMMPEIDGFETCRRLRAIPHGDYVPIIFLTALSDRATYEQALQSGGDDFLGKPVDRTELLMRVRSLLRISRLHDQLRKERDTLLHVQRQKALLGDLIVHDLKNPLSSIIANAEYLGAQLTGEPRNAIEDVQSSAEAMTQMICNLLDISRAEEGAIVPKLAPVNLRDVLEALQRRMLRRVALRQQVIALTAAPTIALNVDESLLVRTIENLVDNAIRYTPSGGMITIHAREDGGSVELTVADEGPGIAPADRERIFEKYAQVERSALDRTNRGLGLVFCRLAVQSLGGEITVANNVPVGTVFRVRLPQNSA